MTDTIIVQKKHGRCSVDKFVCFENLGYRRVSAYTEEYVLVELQVFRSLNEAIGDVRERDKKMVKVSCLRQK